MSTTSASATGHYEAGAIGSYIFDAHAETVCTEGEAESVLHLVYAINGLLPPLANGNKPKAGNGAPIKFIPRDCTGALVAYDSSVHIKVYQDVSLLQDSTVDGCTGPNCGTGNDTTVHYDSATGQYNTLFKTGDTSNITYTVEVWFGGVLNFQTTFVTN